MNDKSDSIELTVLVGSDAVEAMSLGKHEFAVLPRIGEEIVVDARGEQHVLEITGITHFGLAVDTPPGNLQPIRDFPVNVLCKRL